MKKIILSVILFAGFLGATKSNAQASEPLLGQIIPVAFNFAPRGWAQCNGQLLPIAQNSALFSLLGTQFGGNGTTTFALPDLRGRTIIGPGQGTGTINATVGLSGGSETTTLTAQNLPAHTHSIPANTGLGDNANPVNNVPANTGALDKEYSTTSDGNLKATGNAGGGQAFNNMKPYAPVYYIICLQGIFPSRN